VLVAVPVVTLPAVEGLAGDEIIVEPVTIDAGGAISLTDDGA
jgi:hypothetical protein